MKAKTPRKKSDIEAEMLATLIFTEMMSPSPLRALCGSEQDAKNYTDHYNQATEKLKVLKEELESVTE